MSKKSPIADVAADLIEDMPVLRRYARALTGSQDVGDRYAVLVLEKLVATPEIVAGDPSTRIGLFREFHAVWSETGSSERARTGFGESLEERAQWRLEGLEPNTREALLLSALGGFDNDAMARVLNVSQEQAASLLQQARDDMAQMVAGTVFIIEDEGIIAMDLKSIVDEMGHSVSGVARTRSDAVEMATQAKPDLILADVQLADKSSGIDAVKDIWGAFGDVPVIFITAFPERLLTGERPEPAFLISKPYKTEEVRAAVSQALFFATTEHIKEPA